MEGLARTVAAAALLAAAALAVSGCGDDEEAAAGGRVGEPGTREDAAAILRKFPDSTGGGPAAPTSKVVRSAAEWEALWGQVTAHRTPASRAPAVDFAKEMVAFVGLGAKPTAGWSVEIVGARVVEGKLRILYAERGPAPKSVAAAVVTSPWHAVVLARGDLPVEWARYEPPKPPAGN